MPYSLHVNLSAVNGGADYAMLVNKAERYSYENGRKSDIQEGVNLTVALQNAHLSTLIVKYDHDPLPKLTVEQINESCMKCQFLFVRIPDCDVNLYSSKEGGLGMTATAQTAQLVTINSKERGGEA